MVRIEDLKGRVLVGIEDPGDGGLIFAMGGGERFTLLRGDLGVQDIVGDLDNLIGHEILLVEEIIHDGGVREFPERLRQSGWSDVDYSWLIAKWIFHKLATVRGHVVICWFGGTERQLVKGA